MSTAQVLTAIQNSAVAHAVSKTNHMVGAGLQIVHVLGFILLLSSIVLISLRLLGPRVRAAAHLESGAGRDATDLARARAHRREAARSCSFRARRCTTTTRRSS